MERWEYFILLAKVFYVVLLVVLSDQASKESQTVLQEFFELVRQSSWQGATHCAVCMHIFSKIMRRSCVTVRPADSIQRPKEKHNDAEYSLKTLPNQKNVSVCCFNVKFCLVPLTQTGPPKPNCINLGSYILFR